MVKCWGINTRRQLSECSEYMVQEAVAQKTLLTKLLSSVLVMVGSSKMGDSYTVI